MTQQIINTGAVANDGTGESLRNAFTAVNNNFANVWAAGPVDSNVVISNNVVTTNQTNLDLKIAGNGIGNVVVASTLQPTITGVHDLGRATKEWGEVHAQYYYGNGAFLTGIISSNPVFDTIQVNVQATIGNVAIGNNTISTTAANTDLNLSVSGTGIVSSSGNVAAPYFIGDGSLLTNINPANVALNKIQSGTSNVSIVTPGGDITVTVDGTGNVAVFSPSGVNILGNLSVSGNITGSYFLGDGSALTGVLADRGADPNNWNTLTQMGVYTVNRSDWSGTVGTPLDSLVYVGLLEVKNSTNTAIEQSFYPGTVTTGNAKTQWNRTYWGSSWSAWVYVVNDDQVLVGGDF